MLNIRCSNFVKRTVSSVTTLFGQTTKMPLLVEKYNCYLPTQSVNYWSLRRFEVLPLRHFSAQSEQQTIFDVDSDDGFDELILNSEKPVIACFHADWCGPCQSFAPRLEAKVTGQGGKILLAKINVEGGASSLAEQFEVTSIPTIVCFKNGEFFDRIEGAVEDVDLDDLLEDLLMSGEEGEEEGDGGGESVRE